MSDTPLLSFISEIIQQELDEVNAVGAGLVVGSGMGNGGTDASKKLLWSGDEPLKEFIDKVVENVLDKMQQKHVGGAPRKSPYGDTYVGFSSGSEEDTSGRDKQAGIVKKVNKNLNKKTLRASRSTFHGHFHNQTFSEGS